jgi:DNA-directed RNA polymerase subunit alpha
MPKRLIKEDTTATETYAKFIAEPFETGYGHTIGNSLRRVLLSSLEGAAISSIKVDGAVHEFATIDGVVEDMTDVVLNLKKVLFRSHTRDTQTLLLSVNKEGAVTAGDIELVQNLEIVNPKQLICTLDKKKKLEMELEVKVGRGFCPGDENKKPDQAIGVIAIDSLFSPVTRVRYAVEITTGFCWRFGPTAASRPMTRLLRPRPSCNTTWTFSSATTRTRWNSKKPRPSRTTRRPR